MSLPFSRGQYSQVDRAAYSGASLAFRDRLVIEWNKTQQRQTFADPKRVYCRWLGVVLWDRNLIHISRPLSRVPDGSSA